MPGRALVKQRRGGEAWDLPIPRASLRPQPSPGRRSGCPPGDRGPYWNLSFPCRAKIAGCSIHPKQAQSESSRGLSQPLGIHLNYALGLSNEVGPPHYRARNFSQEDNFTHVTVDPATHTLHVRVHDKRGEIVVEEDGSARPVRLDAGLGLEPW